MSRRRRFWHWFVSSDPLSIGLLFVLPCAYLADKWRWFGVVGLLGALFGMVTNMAINWRLGRTWCSKWEKRSK